MEPRTSESQGAKLVKKILQEKTPVKEGVENKRVFYDRERQRRGDRCRGLVLRDLWVTPVEINR